MKTIKINGYEYEAETHDFNKKLSDIKIPKGWELWTTEDCIKLHNNAKYRKELNLEDCWFYIKQPFIFNKKNYNTRFITGSGGAGLNCYGNPQGSLPELGVRFKRKFLLKASTKTKRRK